jgi:hypothetical protein
MESSWVWVYTNPKVQEFPFPSEAKHDLDISIHDGKKSPLIFSICLIGSSSLGSLFIFWKQSKISVHTDSNQAGFLKKHRYIIDVVGLIGAIASIASFYLEHIKRWFGW